MLNAGRHEQALVQVAGHGERARGAVVTGDAGRDRASVARLRGSWEDASGRRLKWAGDCDLPGPRARIGQWRRTPWGAMWTVRVRPLARDNVGGTGLTPLQGRAGCPWEPSCHAPLPMSKLAPASLSNSDSKSNVRQLQRPAALSRLRTKKNHVGCVAGCPRYDPRARPAWPAVEMRLPDVLEGLSLS